MLFFLSLKHSNNISISNMYRGTLRFSNTQPAKFQSVVLITIMLPVLHTLILENKIMVLTDFTIL